jgi:hypothetical protein
MSSCIDDLKSKGYYVVTLDNGFIIKPDNVGSCRNVYGLFFITYIPTQIKRLKIRFSGNVNAVGQITQQVNCAVGFAIKRVVLWNYDPMTQVMNTMNSIMQLMIIADLLRTLTGVLSI